MNSAGEYESIKAADFQAKYGKKKTLRKKSNAEINKEMTQSFLNQCKEAGLQNPLCEFKFNRDRKWRVDFFFALGLLAVEIEGFGHHKLGMYMKDLKKYNELTFAGIHLLRFTVAEVLNGTAIQQIKRYVTANRIA